ncbi:hypothetical protein LEP1GSC188_3380 [Leptospira weilii serovar Topaz str. LT2116]|uniref:Uncharacterized protein n=1 Tax=Leptospira weilii serovar Topaz str. LT2116 TaxID=1088540 RepID=M3H0F8_9LEPT|nr:hypothetical protein LEP1GSC188_3380 [Leptospira weilii serovar Topaz str. LT2116]
MKSNFSEILTQTIQNQEVFFQKDSDGDEIGMNREDATRQTARLRQMIDRYRPLSSSATSPLSGVLHI